MDIILITKGTGDEETLREKIRRFGRYVVKKGILEGIYKVKVPKRQALLDYGFKKNILHKVVFNLSRGKRMHHLFKTTGNVRRDFYGYDVLNEIDHCGIVQSFQCKMALHLLSDRLFKKYREIYTKRFEGVDLDTDPITCNDIIDPCYILPDWKSGNKVVLDIQTIFELRYKEKEYTGFTVGEDGRDIYHYRWVYDENYFVSPYTRKIFRWEDVVFVRKECLITND